MTCRDTRSSAGCALLYICIIDDGRASPSPDRLVQRHVRSCCVDAPLSQAILRLEFGPLRIQHLKKIRDPFPESQARQLGSALARGARLLELFHLESRRAI